MKKIIKENDEKIDIEEILTKFRIPFSKNYTFQAYMKEIWKDLSERSNNKGLGIDRVTFAKYFDLPGLINERLFSVFDIDSNNFISKAEFLRGMNTLYTGEFIELIKFIFAFYDFDKDNYITKEDIRVVLSYIPLKITKQESLNVFKFENENYKDRVESQEELSNILGKLFQNENNIKIDTYKSYVEKVSSETFIYVLIFLLERRPFTFHSVFSYRYDMNENGDKSDSSMNNPVITSPLKKSSKFLIAEPSLESKFSPSKTLADSPTMQKKRLSTNVVNNSSKQQNFLINLVGANPKQAEKEKPITKEIDSPTKEMRDVNKKAKTSFNINIINSDMKNVSIADMFDFKPDITNELEQELIDDELKLEIPLFFGSLYKITNTKSFKKMTYRILNKDFYCKFLYKYNMNRL